MVKYLLDTCTVIDFLRCNTSVQEKILSAGLENCAISELTLAKLYIGPKRILSNKRASEKEKQRATLQMESLTLLKETFSVLPLSGFAERFADVHENLRQTGESVEDIDLLIGTFAASNGFVLVTGNTRHFVMIPGLRLENW